MTCNKQESESHMSIKYGSIDSSEEYESAEG